MAKMPNATSKSTGYREIVLYTDQLRDRIRRGGKRQPDRQR